MERKIAKYHLIIILLSLLYTEDNITKSADQVIRNEKVKSIDYYRDSIVLHKSSIRDWCDEGYVDDCSGDGDCCPESWIGDGFVDCEDQTWGCDLTCYDNDGGDCGFVCGDGVCDHEQYENEINCPEDCDCSACDLNYTEYGSECCDTAWYGYGINCITLENNYNWNCSGCACPGDEEYFCGDGYCNGDETASNCQEDCDIGPCADGYLLDCSGDADCCPESWIGDGYADCEEQEWGCDLTCYDEDGGDCDTSCEGFECEDGSCVDNQNDCPEINCNGQIIEIVINSNDFSNISWTLEEEVDAYQGWFTEFLYGSHGQIYCDIENKHSFLFNIFNNNDGICCNGENRSYDILIDGCSMIDVMDAYAYYYDPEYFNFNPNEYMALRFSDQGTILSPGENLTLINFSDISNVSQDCLYEFYINPVNGNSMNYSWGYFEGEQLHCQDDTPACFGLNENNLIANFNAGIETIFFKHDGCVKGYTSLALADFSQQELIYFRWWGEDDDSDCYENDLDNCPDEYNAYQSNYDGDEQGDVCDLDDDNDNVPDVHDIDDYNQYECSDDDNDTCDDCSSGNGYDPTNDGDDNDADGICDSGDLDDDNDGIIDTEDCDPIDYNVNEFDCCGVCGGNNSQCSNCCGSPFYDDCSDDCYIDLNGECCYSLEVDICGFCGGNGTECIYLGDMNGDSIINVLDIVLAVELVLYGNYDFVGDVNEDGSLDVLDIVMLVDWVLNP